MNNQSYLADAGLFLINAVIGFYLLVVLLRFLFQLMRVEFHNPVSQFVLILTAPPLRFLRRFIPGLGGIDLSSLVLALAIALIKISLIGLVGGIRVGPASMLVIAVADILETIVYIFIFATIARAILSWFQQGGYHPVVRILDTLTDPLLLPLRRLLPPIGGLDFSPFVLIILLSLALKLIVNPIADSGYMMLF
jgi:YggT family protein